MVDGINTYGAGTTVARVVQDAATPPKKREGGAATDDTKASQKATDTVQSQAIKNLLKKEVKESGDFVSQAEAILNKALSLKSADTKLSIAVDDESGLFVYKGIDKNSGEVVSQFPAEQVLALIAYYREAEGLVVDETA
jgi:flagellar protein FlaG|tara:strand:+ start:51668 stop:52084 length:417 start_codon:yes stop_codon:yes gene_type:complete